MGQGALLSGLWSHSPIKNLPGGAWGARAMAQIYMKGAVPGLMRWSGSRRSSVIQYSGSAFAEDAVDCGSLRACANSPAPNGETLLAGSELWRSTPRRLWRRTRRLLLLRFSSSRGGTTWSWRSFVSSGRRAPNEVSQTRGPLLYRLQAHRLLLPVQSLIVGRAGLLRLPRLGQSQSKLREVVVVSLRVKEVGEVRAAFAHRLCHPAPSHWVADLRIVG